jgi:hypothetical protein
VGRNIGRHHIVDNKATAESHKDWNKIAIQHLDKLGKARLSHMFADNIVVAVVAVDIAVTVDIVAVVDIAVVDKRELRLLADKPRLPSLPALGDKNNQARLFVVLASA